MAGRFDGRRVLVTGGATGLGLALARRFGAEGARVVVAGRRVEALGEAAATLRADGADAAAVVLDVTEPRSVREAFAVVAAGGPLDVVVLNAGVASFAPFAESDAAADATMIATNLAGAIATARAAIPLFPSRGGVLVGVASIAARRVFPNCAVYSATKAGLVAFLDVLREELRPRRIRCLAAIPGAVDTPIWDGAAGTFDRGRMMSAAAAAEAIVAAVRLEGAAAVEEIVLMPEGGAL